MPLLPPTSGKNMPEVDRDSAAPAAATVVEVCKIWEFHLRAVGVAAIAGIAVALVLAPDNRYCCCYGHRMVVGAGWRMRMRGRGVSLCWLS
jgi:hypothetical protein